MRFYISFNCKTIKKLLIPIGIAIAILFGFNTMTVHAATVPSIRNGMNYFVYGNSATEFLDGSQAFGISGNLPVYPFYGQSKIYQHFSWRGMEFIANSPIQGQGISYIITAKFRLLMDGLDNAIANSTFTGCVQFEQGTVVQKTCDVAVGDITAGGATFTIQSTVGLQSTTNLSSLLFSLYATNGSLGTYNIAGGSSAFTTQLSLLDVDVTISQDPNTAILGGIQQEQQETNDKLDDLKEQEKETYDYLTDDTPPESDISALGNVQGLLPPGPVDSLLNIPFKFLSVINSSFGGVCVPLTGEFVYDSTLTLPCFGEMFYDEVPPLLLNFLSLIPASFILIKYLKHLYKKVDRAVSLETTADDEWGVL